MNDNLFAAPKEVNRIDGVLHFDGSCWPNPGPNAQCGYVLVIRGDRHEKTVHLGQGTNNTAEYHGLIHGMTAALEKGVTHLEVYGDSQIVIYGVRRMKLSKNGMPHLEALKAQAIQLALKFSAVDWNWVPRDQNADADALSTADLQRRER